MVFVLFFGEIRVVLAKQLLYGLNHTSSPFCSGYFGDGDLTNYCLSWPRTVILLIASKVTRITDVSYWCLAEFCFLRQELFIT
jgi:hypothetical protein